MENKPEIRFKYNDEWEEKVISQCANVKQGFPFDSKTYNKYGKYNIITIGNVGGDRYIRGIEDSNKIIDLPEGVQEHQILKENDILVSMTGNVGRVSLNKGTGNLLNQRVDVLIKKDNVDGEFLFQRLCIPDFEYQMNLNGQGAAQLNISNSDVEEYKLLVPSFEEQKDISNYLSQIDGLIVNKKDKLEKTKLYKASMLSKMFPKEGSLIPEIRFKKFDGEWDIKVFGKQYQIFNGLNKEKDAFGSGSPIINYMDVNKNTILTDDMIKGLVNLSNEEIKNNIVNPGDILFARTSEVIEEVAFSTAYIGNKNNVVFSGFLLKAAPLSGVNNDSRFIALYMRYSRDIRNQISKLATKTSRSLINGDNLKKVSLKLPKYIEQKSIADFFTNLDEMICNQEKEIETLEHLKKTLLNKMFA